MQVTVEEISPVEKKLAVSIEWPRVAARFDEAYRELGRGVTLKGFRKGKVPRSVLEKLYARQIEAEVRQRLVQESFYEAMQKHDILPVVEPVVDDMKMEKGKLFAYSARVEVKAPFEPKDYFGVDLERTAPDVSAEEVEEALKAKQRELTEFKKIDGRAELRAGDVAFIDVEGTLGERPFKREGAMVDVGVDSPTDAVPGLSHALAGLPLDAKDREVTFTVQGAPEGRETPAEIRDLVGKSVTVKVTVRDSREKNVPTLDDDFARDTGEADSLDELRGKLREKVAEQKTKEQERELRGELVKKLLEKNGFQVAPALVERQLEVVMQRARIQMAMRGIDVRNVQLDETRMKADLRPEAADEVRAWFLLDAIAGKEKVEVTDADLEKRLAEMARERGKNTTRLKAELQKENRLEGVRHQLREEKTLDLLMSRANITVKRD